MKLLYPLIFLLLSCSTEPKQLKYRCSVANNSLQPRVVYDNIYEAIIKDTVFTLTEEYYTNVELGLIKIEYGGIYTDTIFSYTWNSPIIYQENNIVILDSAKALNSWESLSDCSNSGCESISDSSFFCFSNPYNSLSQSQSQCYTYQTSDTTFQIAYASAKCCPIGTELKWEEGSDTLNVFGYFGLVESSQDEYNSIFLYGNPNNISVGDNYGFYQILAIDSLSYSTIPIRQVCR